MRVGADDARAEGAFAAQYLLAQQANRPPPPQPYYMPVPAPAPAPRNCISNVNGNTIYTNYN